MKLLVSFGAAIAGGAAAVAAGAGRTAPLIGRDILALVFSGKFPWPPGVSKLFPGSSG